MLKKLLISTILVIVFGGALVAPTKAIAACPAGNHESTNDQGLTVCVPDVQPVTVSASTCAIGGKIPNADNTQCIDDPNGQSRSQKDASNYSLGSMIFSAIARGIGYILLKISSLVLQISGTIFDTVVKFSIIDMAKNIGNPEGVGGSITEAWATLRDLSYLFFIFILLFAAFQAMFDLNFSSIGKTVRDIIIVALMIPFTLFFSKVVIDASNIVSVGFYNAIISTGSGDTSSQTISEGYENMLNIRSWYSADPVDLVGDSDNKILTIGVLASVFMFVTAVILLISGIMFVARFIILIFLMVVSPLAAIAYIIPGMKKHFTEWKDALISQSFFAPLFFALTWVVFKIGSENNTFLASLGAKSTDKYASLISSPASTTAGIVLNFLMILGFAVAALIFSKKMATESSNFTHFSTLTGAIGGATIGGVAYASRQTLGRGAKALAESGKLRNAAMSDKWYAGAAKAGLWTAAQGSKGSFDLRGSNTLSKVPGVGGELGILGKAGGKGGFSAAIDTKVKAKAAYAKEMYSQTEGEKEEFERRKGKEREDVALSRIERDKKARKTAKETESQRKTYIDDKTKEFSDTITDLNKQKKSKEVELKSAIGSGDKQKADDLNKELGSIATRIENEREAKKERQKEIEDTDEAYAELKEKADEAKEEAKKAKAQLKKKDIDDDELSQETQDIKKAGENRLKTYAEKVKTSSPVSTTAGAVIVGGALSTLGPLGTAIGAGIGAAIGKSIGSSLPDEYNWAGNKAAAKKIKSDAGGKSNKDKLADAYKAYEKEQNPDTAAKP